MTVKLYTDVAGVQIALNGDDCFTAWIEKDKNYGDIEIQVPFSWLSDHEEDGKFYVHPESK
jgi:hypothetical protein